MKLFPWLSNVPSSDPHPINPATGLPMLDDTCSIDVEGNPYGVDLHTHDRHKDSFNETSSIWNDPFDQGSTFDHSSTGSGFDSFGGGFGSGGIGNL